MTHNVGPDKELMIPSTNHRGRQKCRTRQQLGNRVLNLQSNSNIGLVNSSRTVSSGASNMSSTATAPYRTLNLQGGTKIALVC